MSLDGGGVRGLSSLHVLKKLMETINPDRTPKPCEYFDMIGGTSTGGYVFLNLRGTAKKITDSLRLIAIMLGRLQMDIDQCINAYISMFDRVFQKKRHRITIRGKVQDRFDTQELEKAIKEIVFDQCGRQKGAENTLLRDGDGQKVQCKVYDGILSQRRATLLTDPF